MNNSVVQMIKEDAQHVHILVVDDDLVMQSLYRRLFNGIFATFAVKSNGVEAYQYFLSQNDKPIDLIITDHYMPEMDGMELVQKVREKDFNVRIIVMTSEEDLNLMKSYMINGVDAILPKPYDEALTMKVLQRTLHYINEKKLLEQYVEQLELMAKENVERKSAQLQQRTTQERKPKLIKTPVINEDENLEQKYMIRGSVKDMENVDVDELDLIGKERIDAFRDTISDYELQLCSLEPNNLPALRLVLKDVLSGIKELVGAINVLGVFPIAANAATNLIKFVENLDDTALQNSNNRELFIDILVTMLEDFDKWIDLVFISKKTDNIHYFDASFANTCLELEMIFKSKDKIKYDDDNL